MAGMTQRANDDAFYTYVMTRLTALRYGRGWSVAELAQRIGASRWGVAQWERGNKRPSWRNICTLAALYGVDVWTLFPPLSYWHPAAPSIYGSADVYAGRGKL